MKVRDILKVKGSQVYSIRPDQTGSATYRSWTATEWRGQSPSAISSRCLEEAEYENRYLKEYIQSR